MMGEFVPESLQKSLTCEKKIVLIDLLSRDNRMESKIFSFQLGHVRYSVRDFKVQS